MDPSVAIFDVVIVGGGTAGCTQVLLIEAGDDLTDDPMTNLPLMGPSLMGTDTNWGFMTEPQLAVSRGGSSTMNGFAFLHNSRASIDAWAELGNPGWDWISFTKSVARFALASSPPAEGQSPLQITIPEEDNQWPRVWRDTLANLGFLEHTAPLSGDILGSLLAAETIDLEKRRSSAAKAYLSDRVQSRKNLTICTEALATRILTEKDGTVKATEVILCAGAINSPRLLELSGFGGNHRLQRLGVQVVVDNPNVGENLQNHPMFTLNYEVVNLEGFETIDQLLRRDPNAIALAQKHLFSHFHEQFVRAHLTSPTEASGCYMTAPGFICFAGDKSTMPPPAGEEKYFTISVYLAHPLSRGSVHITSPDEPVSASGIAIDPNYFGHPLDLEVLARHVQLAEKIAMTEPLRTHLKLNGERGPCMSGPGGFADIQTAKKYLRDVAVGTHHWVGTCAMMPEEKGGVVDHHLRVYGCPNLRVCDASIIPIAPRSNPQGVIYAIAEHASMKIISTM
ncbi:putative GMC oxidoreductase [Xylariaceae sp. FL0255]|nr:putative GMC oxidoreductase [Xylariaceae sp. FL0255]